MRDKKSLAAFNSMMERQEQAQIKFPDFNFTIDGHLSVEKGEDVITLHSFFHYFDGPVENQEPSITELPAKLFRDERQIKQFASMVNQIFTMTLSDVLSKEASLTLSDATHFALNHLEIDPMDLRNQVKAHTRETARRVAKQLGVQRKGKKAEWERSELARAVRVAISGIPKRERTLAKGAEAMRKRHGARVSNTTEGFRKMLERSGLSWQKLKNGRFY